MSPKIQMFLMGNETPNWPGFSGEERKEWHSETLSLNQFGALLRDRAIGMHHALGVQAVGGRPDHPQLMRMLLKK